ncbi:MAG: hypothetical protein HY371_18375 [Devosia nanyangense]|nr:hypothetical protein [Devosia nanyangense]
MTLAQEMFTIAPATGRAIVSPAQEALLTGKALWLHRAAEADLPVVPTIVITRSAREALQSERRTRDDRLRVHWVATLFRLVGRDGVPPHLVVRTSAPKYTAGLMQAQVDIPAPQSESESVDPAKPLAKAISEAFDSYSSDQHWLSSSDKTARGRQIVLVQALAKGQLRTLLTRDVLAGTLGPASATGQALPKLPQAASALVEKLDALAGRHLSCLVEIDGEKARLASARPIAIAAGAELEAAVDRVNRGMWTQDQAVAAISPARLPQLLHPRLKSDHEAEPIATGLGVSPGAASGLVVFTAEDAARVRARGRHCILVVTETGPTDIEGMKAATGILTARGGMTSHAAVVARVTGKPCVAGVRSLHVDVADLSCRIGDREFRSGDRITIDGSDGSVYAGALPLSQPHIGGAIGTLLNWSDSSRKISVRTNVETVEAARTALSFGAEGIGLARSEHMFFSPERMVALRRMILSEDEADRAKALTGLVDFQTGDYAALFQTMGGRPPSP